MSKKLRADDARQSLNAHVVAKDEELQVEYGPHTTWKELARILGGPRERALSVPSGSLPTCARERWRVRFAGRRRNS